MSNFFLKYLIEEYHINNQRIESLPIATGLTLEFIQRKLEANNYTLADLIESEPPRHYRHDNLFEICGGLASIIGLKKQGLDQKQITHYFGYKSASSLRDYLETRGLTWDEI